MYEENDVHVYKDGMLSVEKIKLPEEKPVTINVNGDEFVTLLCTPTNLQELAVGFLASEKIVSGIEQVRDVLVNVEKGFIWIELEEERKFIKDSYGKRYLTSGCGRGTVFYQLNDALKLDAIPIERKYNIAEVSRLSEILARKKDDTGGMHKSALTMGEEIVVSRNDVGRHNAVDKVLGSILYDKIEVEGAVLFTSGRISSEILTKAHTMGVSVVASLSSPTSLALHIARKLNITLIGYVRGSSLRIYTAVERMEL